MLVKTDVKRDVVTSQVSALTNVACNLTMRISEDCVYFKRREDLCILIVTIARVNQCYAIRFFLSLLFIYSHWY